MDTLLSSYLKKTLDSRIPGFFAAGVKRGYSLSDELKSRESILQLLNHLMLVVGKSLSWRLMIA